jgi:hypothetical protein
MGSRLQNGAQTRRRANTKTMMPMTVGCSRDDLLLGL